MKQHDLPRAKPAIVALAKRLKGSADTDPEKRKMSEEVLRLDRALAKLRRDPEKQAAPPRPQPMRRQNPSQEDNFDVR